LHGSALAVAGIIAGIFASRLIARFGRGVVLRLASFGGILAVVIYTWPSAPYAVTLSAAFLAGFAGTFIVISVNAFLLSHQGPAGPASLTEANALASVSGLIAPLAVGAGAATIFGWRAGVLVVAVGLIIVEVIRGRRTDRFGAPAAAEHAEHRAAPLPRRMYWTFALIMCFLGTEFSMVLWSADLLRERAGYGAAAAAASLAAVTGGMAIGRYVGSRLAEYWEGDRVLRISVVIALIGFAVAWISTDGVVMLVGLFVTGLGIGVHWPLGVARAVHASGGMTDRASALASVYGSTAIGIAPFLLGALSDAFGFHQAFLLVPVMLGASLVILLLKPDRTPVFAPTSPE
jgi:fucose permease